MWNQETLAFEELPAGSAAGGDAMAPRSGTNARCVAMLWRRRWAIVGSLVLSMAGALSYLKWAPRTVTATARISAQHEVTRPSNELAALFGQTSPSPTLYNIRREMKSKAVVTEALQGMQPGQMQIFEGVGDPVLYVSRKLNITNDKDDSILVSLEGNSREEAARVVNGVVQTYAAWQARQRDAASGEVVQTLQKRLDEWNRLLDKQEEAIRKFRVEHRALAFDSSNPVMQHLARLSEAWVSDQISTNNFKDMLESAEAMIANPQEAKAPTQRQLELAGLSEINQQRWQLTGKVNELQSRLQLLGHKYLARQPEMVGTQNQLNDTNAKLAELNGQLPLVYREAVRARLAEAQQSEERAHAAFEKQAAVAFEMNSEATTYAKLIAEQKRIEKMVDTIDSRIKEANLARTTTPAGIRILETPYTFDSQQLSRSQEVLSVALAIGLLLATMSAFALELADQRFHGSDQVVAMLDLPVLAVIGQRRNTTDAIDRAAAEACRSALASLECWSRSWAGKKLLIASADEGEGRSTVTIHLAAALARSGRQVLVIDANVHGAVLDKRLGVTDAETGLFEVLEKKGPVRGAIHPTATTGLDLLAAGTTSANSASLLDSRAFGDLLEELAEDYDHILIDSASLAAASDARAIASVCDVTLMVVRPNASRRGNAQLALGSLLSVGARVLGVVVNDAPHSGTASGLSGSWHCRYNASAMTMRGAGAYPVGSGAVRGGGSGSSVFHLPEQRTPAIAAA